MGDCMTALATILGIDARTKYVLVKWMQRYGSGGSIQMPMKRIAADLGVTDRLAREAVFALVGAGLMVRTELIQRGRGRPRVSYRCVFPFPPDAVLVSPREGAGAGHQMLVDRLLEASPGQFGGAAKAGLDKPGKILLASLLLYADSCGVVREVSRSRLAALVGMDLGMLARRLRALRADGYIRSYVVGVRGRRLFGAAPGMYFLNLNHPTFGSAARMGVITICGDFLTGNGAAYAEGIGPFHAADGVRRDRLMGISIPGRLATVRDTLVWDESLPDFLALFEVDHDGVLVGKAGGRKRVLAWYLQAKLEEYASMLLSEHWEALSGYKIPDIPELLARIDADILPPGALDDLGYEEEPPDFKRQRVVKFVFQTSLGLARRIWRVMKVIPGHSFAGMTHRIIPFTKKWGRPYPANWGVPVVRAVISFPRVEVSGVAAPSAVFHMRRAGKGVVPEKYGEEGLDWKTGESSRVLDTMLGVLLAERFVTEAAVSRRTLELCGLLYEPETQGALGPE